MPPTLGRENSILNDSKDLVPARDTVGIKGFASLGGEGGWRTREGFLGPVSEARVDG